MKQAEDKRFDFLVERDGKDKAIEFERQAAKCYRIAAEFAMKPKEDEEKVIRAKGREWETIYKNAEKECLRVIAENTNGI